MDDDLLDLSATDSNDSFLGKVSCEAEFASFVTPTKVPLEHKIMFKAALNRRAGMKPNALPTSMSLTDAEPMFAMSESTQQSVCEPHPQQTQAEAVLVDLISFEDTTPEDKTKKVLQSLDDLISFESENNQPTSTSPTSTSVSAPTMSSTPTSQSAPSQRNTETGCEVDLMALFNPPDSSIIIPTETTAQTTTTASSSLLLPKSNQGGSDTNAPENISFKSTASNLNNNCKNLVDFGDEDDGDDDDDEDEIFFGEVTSKECIKRVDIMEEKISRAVLGDTASTHQVASDEDSTQTPSTTTNNPQQQQQQQLTIAVGKENATHNTSDHTRPPTNKCKGSCTSNNNETSTLSNQTTQLSNDKTSATIQSKKPSRLAMLRPITASNIKAPSVEVHVKPASNRFVSTIPICQSTGITTKELLDSLEHQLHTLHQQQRTDTANAV